MVSFKKKDVSVFRLKRENKLLRKIIFGGKRKTGMMEHTDPYYKGCWDKLLEKVKNK